MAYMTIIEDSESWTCPASGDYKVVCIGNGGSGVINSGGNKVGESGEINEAVLTFTAATTVQCTFTNYISFGSYMRSATGSSYVPALSEMEVTKYAVGGDGGFTLDGVYGGAGAACSLVTSGSTTTAAYCAPASKNGGAPGRPGFGYGAGGGCTDSAVTNGTDGAIIITQI